MVAVGPAICTAECKEHFFGCSDLQFLILISQVIDPVGQHRDFLLVQLTRKLGYPRIDRRHITQAGHGQPVASLPRLSAFGSNFKRILPRTASRRQDRRR